MFFLIFLGIMKTFFIMNVHDAIQKTFANIHNFKVKKKKKNFLKF
jgi:hypothetical protein